MSGQTVESGEPQSHPQNMLLTWKYWQKSKNINVAAQLLTFCLSSVSLSHVLLRTDVSCCQLVVGENHNDIMVAVTYDGLAPGDAELYYIYLISYCLCKTPPYLRILPTEAAVSLTTCLLIVIVLTYPCSSSCFQFISA